MEDEIEALKSLYMDQVHVLAKNGDNDCECILRVGITMRVEEVAAAASVAHCPIKIFFTIPNTQEDSESVPEFGTELPENARPNLERSISGRRFQTTVEVQELPPLDLCVIYKPGYPDVAPDFTISSDWLTGSELTWLCANLDELAKQNEGLPIVAMWIDWLENQAASGLGLDGCYNIVAPGIEDQDKDEGIIDLRAISLTSNVFERMFVILKNDQMAQIRQFLSRVHECPVCLDEKRGVDMFQLRSCGHFFCLDCLGEYVRTKLTDGAVNSINCPTRSCDGTVPPSAIRQVLGDSEFERFDALALSRALDSMADVEWCPRCNQVVISDDSFLARCPNCFYAFCLKCHEAYHQDTQCTSVLEQFEATKIKMEEEEGINKDSEAAKQIQKKRKQLNLLSQALIKKIAKKCPKCRTPIEKFDGCNKIICTQCGTNMCWLCGQLISGYDHFSATNCATFTIDENDELYGILRRAERLNPAPPEEYVQMQQRLDENPELRQRTVRCPQCRQDNLKGEDRNNHIRCWSCRSSVCYRCHVRILPPITAHFANNRCPHHSDD